jgi:hypothetical protein
MALQKDKIIKGITANYWKIVNCDTKTGFVALALYLNKEHAKARENMLDGRVTFQIDFPVDVSNPIAYAYGKVKESKMETRVITEATETEESITEEVETNWFNDAVDC